MPAIGKDEDSGFSEPTNVGACRLCWMLHSCAAANCNSEMNKPTMLRLPPDDSPIFLTVAKLVDALKGAIPEGTENAERKKEA